MNFGRNPYEDFDDEENGENPYDYGYEEGEGRGMKWASAAVVVGAVGLFIGLAYYAYEAGMRPVDESEIPYFSEDKTPYREKPEDPGGLKFEHQDRVVYNELAAGKADEEKLPEKALPEPEKPIEREVVMAPAEEPSRLEAITAPPEEAKQPEKAEAAPVDAKAASEAGKDNAQETVTVVASKTRENETMTVIEPKPEPKATAKPVLSGAVYAQLGAFKSEAEAKDAWNKLYAVHKEKLPVSKPFVEQADLGEKGVFHRLQAGPLASEDEARALCKYLQSHKQGCFVVKK